MKSFSTHSTVPIRRDSLQPAIQALKTAEEECSIMCEKHSSEAVNKYCKTCKKLICDKCVQEIHKLPTHQTDNFSNSARSKREELQKSVKHAKEAHQKLTDRVNSAQLSREVLLKQSETMKRLVRTNIQMLQEKLEELQTKFLGEIDSTVESHRAKLTDDITKHSLMAEASEHLMKMGEQAIEHTSDVELLSIKRYMSNRLKELSPKNLPTDKDFSTPVELPTGMGPEIMQIVIAHIDRNLSPSLEASKLTGMGIQKTAVGKEATFVVHSLTRVGEPCIEKQVVDVDITVARTEEKIPTVLSKGSEIGTYTVKYVPEAKGEYKVAVKIEGNPIKGSPFSVVARGVVDPWYPTLVIDKQEWPWGVACNVNREIYVTRNYHHMISVFNREGKYLRKIGLKGQSPGSLWHPTGIAVDRECNMYVADGKESGRLQKFSSDGQLVAIYKKLRKPQGVLLSKQEDRLYVCDRGNRTVVVLDTDLEEKKIFGELDHFSQDDGFESVSGHLLSPHSAAEGDDGNIFVADTQCIHIFTKEGVHLKIIEHPKGEFALSGIAIDGDHLYVCDLIKNCLWVLSTSGKIIGTKGGLGKNPGQFNKPMSLAVDYDGYLYVSDYANNRVQVF